MGSYDGSQGQVCLDALAELWEENDRERAGEHHQHCLSGGSCCLEDHLAYSASKAAVPPITKTRALEWAQGEQMKKLIPNGRFAQPHEVASLTLYLSSTAAAMINSENVVMDGGYSIR